jgi:hypothetical protein|tara:strand:- start:1535 stop:1741 length:207 start_codon:yes stop_codon:yes gene_type:complete
MNTMYQPTIPLMKSKSTDTKQELDIKRMFNDNIYEALQQAMTIKSDDMELDDFKNLVMFILNVKCNLI